MEIDIRKLRAAITQDGRRYSTISAAAGIHASALSRIMGYDSTISRSVFAALCEALGHSTDEFMATPESDWTVRLGKVRASARTRETSR